MRSAEMSLAESMYSRISHWPVQNEPWLTSISRTYTSKLKKPELAVKYAEKAVQVDPKNFSVYQMLFEVYLALKQKNDAEAILIRAQKLASNDPNFWLSLVDLSIQLY